MNLPLLPFRMVILIATAIIGAFVGGIISSLRLLIKCSFDGKITKKEQEQVERSLGLQHGNLWEQFH